MITVTNRDAVDLLCEISFVYTTNLNLVCECGGSMYFVTKMSTKILLLPHEPSA